MVALMNEAQVLSCSCWSGSIHPVDGAGGFWMRKCVEMVGLPGQDIKYLLPGKWLRGGTIDGKYALSHNTLF